MPYLLTKNGELLTTAVAWDSKRFSRLTGICFPGTVPDGYSFDNGVVVVRWEDPVVSSPPEPTAEEIAIRTQREVTVAIQKLLDDTARIEPHRYDSIHTACGWAGEFADANALKSWAASCWRKAGEIEADVLAGERPLPTPAEVLAELPEFGG